MLLRAASLADADDELTATLTADVIGDVLALVPDEWLLAIGRAPVGPARPIGRYLVDRLAAPRAFVEEAARVR